MGGTFLLNEWSKQHSGTSKKARAIAPRSPSLVEHLADANLNGKSSNAKTPKNHTWRYNEVYMPRASIRRRSESSGQCSKIGARSDCNTWDRIRSSNLPMHFLNGEASGSATHRMESPS